MKKAKKEFSKYVPVALIAAAIVIASLAIYSSTLQTTAAARVTIYGSGGPVTINSELALTAEEQALGLMYRESMPESNGMLFVFDGEVPRSFWMKNTKLPLDLIYISSNLTITDIKRDFQPCLTDPCSVYTSKPAMFVLEVNAGFSERHGISLSNKVGMKLK